MVRRRIGSVFGILVFLLLVGLFGAVLNVPVAKASGTIYIRADGSIDPPAAPIASADNVTYAFTDSINSDADGIVVERSNIIMDGNGYTLQGSGYGTGFSLTVSNVTIRNMNIKGGFYIGISVSGSSDNTVLGNNITDNSGGYCIGLFESSNNRILGNNILNDAYGIGIRLEYSFNNTITGTKITNNMYGIDLSYSSNNNITGNNITNNWSGVFLGESSNNTIFGNEIAENHEYEGIGLYESSDNRILGNNITANTYFGIDLESSSNNTLADNSMMDNRYNLRVDGTELGHFSHSIDSSNLVDGKPVYYVVNRQDMEIPSSAGYVALINSYNITVKGLELRNNYQGILLANTTNSQVTSNNISYSVFGVNLWLSSNDTIASNNVTNSNTGVYCHSAPDNTITGNIVANSSVGIQLTSSSDNTITGNNMPSNNYAVQLDDSPSNSLSGNGISNDSVGVYLYDSSSNTIFDSDLTYNDRGVIMYSSNYNTLSGSNITNNLSCGVELGDSSYNVISRNNITNNGNCGISFSNSPSNEIYHNNFINNSQQIRYSYDMNIWDHGYASGGNYWSDYNGTDMYKGLNQDELGADGIGDTPYIIDPDYNRDNYPLMAPCPSGPGLHELEVSLTGAPNQILIGNSTLLEATVSNKGFCKEENVVLFLLVNNTLVNSTSISFLEVDSSCTINYQWTPLTKGWFNVTAYATSVPGEVYVVNNRKTTFSYSRGNTVHNINTGLDYFTIQEAIDAPETLAGHTITVEAGIYSESVMVNKNDLWLVGEDPATTIIDGDNILNGFTIFGTNGVHVSNFTVRNGYFGVAITASSNTMLRNMSMIDNYYNFYLEVREPLNESIQDVDSSNTVDGKPIYYWVGQSDKSVPSEAGYVALVSSYNITVEGLELKNNEPGILLAGTTNSHVTNNNITGYRYGIWLYNGSSNNNVSGNVITNSSTGVYVSESSNNNNVSENMISSTGNSVNLCESCGNTIAFNNITDNNWGIHLFSSSNSNIILGNHIENSVCGILIEGYTSGSTDNIISENNITNNTYCGVWLYMASSNTVHGNNIKDSGSYGVWLVSSYGNRIYHNNIINNTIQAPSPYASGTNAWDDGYPSSGNYWSDYKGLDANGDGTGDTPYIINGYNKDNYPLMSPWPSGPGLHELEVNVNAPRYLQPDNSTLLEAIVSNKGFFEEENVTLFLYLDGNIVNSTTISLLETGSSYTINYLWTPTAEGLTNVTACAVPVQGEILVENNRKTAFVTVSINPPVQNLNTGLYYETIQEAIDAPETLDGHTILVKAGTYYEHVTISKSLKITGEDRTHTIIDGSKTGSFVVQINANNVVLSGLTIQNSNVAPTPAIQIYSSNNVVSNNTIVNNGWGIYAFSVSNNTIENNIITNNVCGIDLEWVTAHTVTNNTISNSQEAGIYLSDSSNNIFTDNIIKNNKDAIVLGGSNNKIYHNNFINNTSPGFGGTAEWDNGYPSGGNLWSDYAGADIYSGPYQNETGSDGIGDTPYTYWPDRYPLVNPIGSPQPPIAIFTYNPEHPLKEETVMFNATASDDRDGFIASYKWNFGDGNITTTADPIIAHIYGATGTYQVNLIVTDNDGLGHSTIESISAIQDSTPPETIHDYDGLWHTSDFTITLTTTDDLSGVAETYYRINDGPIQNISAYGQPLVTTEGTNNTLEYWSVDNAGNEEDHHILTGIELDKTAPAIDIPSRKPAGDVEPDQSVKVSVNITDTASQVKNVTLNYSLNNGTTWEEPIPMNLNASTSLYEATIPRQEAGTTVRFRIVAYDNAGNNATLDGTEPHSVYQVIPEFSSSLILPIFMIITLLAVIAYKRKRPPL